ncbi:MAG: EVE domain-containing protein [Candidatus Paceibacterota bacterium]
MAKQYWLMKGEPEEFGIDDLEKQGTAIWDGVRNYQVRNMFRDVMRKGDVALFYHSNADPLGVVGEMEVIEVPVIDPSQFDRKSKYFDAKSAKTDPRWLSPKVKFIKKFNKVVTLKTLKEREEFSEIPFVKKGNRLSVCQISAEQYASIKRLGG